MERNDFIKRAIVELIGTENLLNSIIMDDDYELDNISKWLNELIQQLTGELK